MTKPWVSCWQPVSVGAAMVNDDDAIIVMPLDTPAIKLYPIAMVMIVMVFGDDSNGIW